MSRRLPFHVLLLPLVLCSGCTCDQPERATPPAPSAAPSAEPSCPSLPPVDQWQSVRADFFEAKLPPSFTPAKIDEGKGYWDVGAKRRIQFSAVVLPVARMSVAQAIDKLNEGVRKQAEEPVLGLKLGPTLRGGTEREPLRFYQVTAPDRAFAQGLVGRVAGDGRLHAALVIYEDDGADTIPRCMMDHAKAIMQTISIPPTAGGAASASAGPVAPPPIVRFTPAAVAELKKQLAPGETVWVGVNRNGAEYSYALDVGEKVPDDVEKLEVEGIPVAVDRGSVPLLMGSTVDFLPGQGFKFDNPNVKR